MATATTLLALSMVAVVPGGALAGQPWGTLDQAHMANVMDVTVSSNGVDVAYVVKATVGGSYNLSDTS